MTSIRPARLEDCKELGAFLVAAWRDSFADIIPRQSLDKEDPDATAARCAEIIADPTRLAFVALGNEQIVGATFAIQPEPGTIGGKIKSLFVDRSWHRRGIGRTLMAHVAREFMDRGASELTLGVFRENLKARRFYEALGGFATHEAPLEWDGHVYPEVQYRFANLAALSRAGGIVAPSHDG